MIGTSVVISRLRALPWTNIFVDALLLALMLLAASSWLTWN